MPRGYDQILYSLPFHHHSSFQAKLFVWKSLLSEAQTAQIGSAKQVIYDRFQVGASRWRAEGQGRHPGRLAALATTKHVEPS